MRFGLNEDEESEPLPQLTSLKTFRRRVLQNSGSGSHDEEREIKTRASMPLSIYLSEETGKRFFA